MKEVYSKIYISRDINFRGNIVKFDDNGTAKVNEKLFEEIKEANLSQIVTRKEDAKEIKTPNEKDADKTIEVLKQEYLKEIDHLKNIIVGKDKQIEQLKKERDAWKNEVTKSSKKTERDDKKEDILKDLEEMTLEELVDLAKGENVTLTNKEDKETVIKELISFYEKK